MNKPGLTNPVVIYYYRVYGIAVLNRVNQPTEVNDHYVHQRLQCG